MARSLTEQQLEFIELVGKGLRPTQAAEKARYAHPGQEAYRLMRVPRVVSAIRERREAAINGDLASLAVQTMRELMDKEHSPAAVRYQASKWVLEHAGHANGTEESTARKELTDMSKDELAEVVNGGMQALGELAQQLQGHHVVDGQPRRLKELNAVQPDSDDGSDLLD